MTWILKIKNKYFANGKDLLSESQKDAVRYERKKDALFMRDFTSLIPNRSIFITQS
jgi:hypothetical protein